MHAGHEACYITVDIFYASTGTIESMPRLIARHRARPDGSPTQAPTWLQLPL